MELDPFYRQMGQLCHHSKLRLITINLTGSKGSILSTQPEYLKLQHIEAKNSIVTKANSTQHVFLPSSLYLPSQQQAQNAHIPMTSPGGISTWQQNVHYKGVFVPVAMHNGPSGVESLKYGNNSSACQRSQSLPPTTRAVERT